MPITRAASAAHRTADENAVDGNTFHAYSILNSSMNLSGHEGYVEEAQQTDPLDDSGVTRPPRKERQLHGIP